MSIYDASRIAFSRVMKDERKASAVAFLKAALAYYASLGVKVERVMTDNGSCYGSTAFAKACKKRGLKHIFTKSYTPKTNGKAERFIQTVCANGAMPALTNTSDERTAELPRSLHRYNWRRPHGSIGSKPPISRLGLTGNNLLGLHSQTAVTFALVRAFTSMPASAVPPVALEKSLVHTGMRTAELRSCHLSAAHAEGGTLL